jgi:Sec-independent protein translocase protein TatA
MHVVLAHPWLTVLVVAVVVLAPFAVRALRRANRKVNAALRDFQRPAQTPANAPAPKETHTR